MLLVMGAAGTTLFAAAVFFVDGRPSATFGFVLRNAPLLVPLLDVQCLSLLLVGIGRFVSLRHRTMLLFGHLIMRPVQQPCAQVSYRNEEIQNKLTACVYNAYDALSF